MPRSKLESKEIQSKAGKFKHVEFAGLQGGAHGRLRRRIFGHGRGAGVGGGRRVVQPNQMGVPGMPGNIGGGVLVISKTRKTKNLKGKGKSTNLPMSLRSDEEMHEAVKKMAKKAVKKALKKKKKKNY